MTLIDEMQQSFYREVAKHGQCCGHTEFDAYINSMTMYSLLEEISYHLSTVVENTK